MIDRFDLTIWETGCISLVISPTPYVLSFVFSHSVQQTLYHAATDVLRRLPSVRSVGMRMPNKHYFPVDMAKFSQLVGGDGRNDEVFVPLDKPSGMIEATLGREGCQGD